MTWRFVSAVVAGAALLASAPASAAQPATSSPTANQLAPTDSPTAGTKRTPYIGWVGIGFYNVGITVDTPFGSVSGSDTYFGMHAGGAANLVALAPDLPLVGWGDISLTLGRDFFFPLAAGVGVRYDKAGPLQLLGGLGVAVLPHTGGGTTPLGMRILAMALYPLPQVNPNLSGQAQLSYDILSDGFHLFTFTVGVGMAL